MYVSICSSISVLFENKIEQKTYAQICKNAYNVQILNNLIVLLIVQIYK